MARNSVVRDYGGVSADVRRDDRRQRLITVGRDIWGRAGLGDITVRGVCKESGLVYRYFYEHFANRDELILAIADQVRGEIVAALVETSSAAGGGVEQRLRAALLGFLRVLEADPRMFRIITSDPAGVAGLAERRRDTLDLVAGAMVTAAADLPDAKPTDPAATFTNARFIVGGVNRLIEVWLVERDRSVDEIADDCTRLSMAVARG